MDRGPYFMDGSGPFGQGHDDDIGDFNKPLAGQPGDVCRIIPGQLLRMNLDLVFRLAAAPSLRRSQHPHV
jgi:hypothetical protein